jgi:hypothetical protein
MVLAARWSSCLQFLACREDFALTFSSHHKEALCIALHPGTVDAALSRPSQASVPEGKLFTSICPAKRLLQMVDSLDGSNSGMASRRMDVDSVLSDGASRDRSRSLIRSVRLMDRMIKVKTKWS